MRSVVFVCAFAAATLALAQQGQRIEEPNQQQLDKQTQDRLRVEGAAGGVRPSTPQERAGADAGAGPNRTHKERRGGQSRKDVDDKGTAQGEGTGAGAGSTAR